MTESLLIDAVGSVVRIDLTGLDREAATAVRHAWRDALSTDGSAAASVVTPDGTADRAVMLMRLSQQVTLAAIDGGRGKLWMLHAAGVALADGRVVVLVGPSGRGKTTAARVLGQDFGYVSDETIGIGADGTVFSYRKPLSLIERQGAPKVERSPSEVGLKRLPDAALRVAAIVLLDRRVDGPAEPTVEPTDLGDAIDDLVGQSSSLAAMESPLRTITAHAEATGGTVRVTYRDVESLPPIIESLASRPPTRIGWRPVVTATSGPAASGHAGGTYDRAPFLDAIGHADPDRIVVLHRPGGIDRVHMMGGVAPEIWRAASGVGFDDLVAAAVAAHGEPEGLDTHRAVAAAVQELLDVGLLNRAGPPRVDHRRRSDRKLKRVADFTVRAARSADVRSISSARAVRPAADPSRKRPRRAV